MVNASGDLTNRGRVEMVVKPPDSTGCFCFDSGPLRLRWHNCKRDVLSNSHFKMVKCLAYVPTITLMALKSINNRTS